MRTLPAPHHTCSAVTFRSNRSRSIRAQTDPPGACAVRYQSVPRWPAQAPPRSLHSNLSAPARGWARTGNCPQLPLPEQRRGIQPPERYLPNQKFVAKGRPRESWGPGAPAE